MIIFLYAKYKKGIPFLIADGHTYHKDALDFLQLPNKQNVIGTYLPRHTAQSLQSLDRGFFKPLKKVY